MPCVSCLGTRLITHVPLNATKSLIKGAFKMVYKEIGSKGAVFDI